MNDHIPTDVRKGDWIQTFSGRQFWPMDPRPSEVHIEDIAHALSLTCRYNGHVKRFYSVAEHSVLVALAVSRMGASPVEQMIALLHDAAEAYLSDVPRPVKRFLRGYTDAEEQVERAVAIALDLPHYGKTPRIAEADTRIVVDEMAELLHYLGEGWELEMGGRLKVPVQGMCSDLAERLFLGVFGELRRGTTPFVFQVEVSEDLAGIVAAPGRSPE